MSEKANKNYSFNHFDYELLDSFHLGVAMSGEEVWKENVRKNS